MSKFKRILCPVDLSKNSTAAIGLASTLAKQYDSRVTFLFVSQVWHPRESGIVLKTESYSQELVEEERAELFALRPTDDSVQYEHEFISGNAGPEIVQATKTADWVVMSTHGRGAVMRLLMGSVAQYVLRNAKCPVLLVKGGELSEDERSDFQPNEQNHGFVTGLMHQAPAIHPFDNMESVLAELKRTRETAAAVVDGSGRCIGILTMSDITKFQSLKARFEAKDESVIDEMFEVNQYGQRRASNHGFNKVERHMTEEVITIRDSQTVQQAMELFRMNPDIHHLVVLDNDCHAVGIVDAQDVKELQLLEPSESGESSGADS